jgi:hypothetical protein
LMERGFYTIPMQNIGTFTNGWSRLHGKTSLSEERHVYQGQTTHHDPFNGSKEFKSKQFTVQTEVHTAKCPDLVGNPQLVRGKPQTNHRSSRLDCNKVTSMVSIYFLRLYGYTYKTQPGLIAPLHEE